MTPAVALGVTVDDAIHFMLWCRHGQERGMGRTASIMYAYKDCARPIYQSWSVIGLGLVVFALSSFTPTQRFGILMFAMLTLSSIGNLVLLPAALASPLGTLFWQRGERQRRIAAVRRRRRKRAAAAAQAVNGLLASDQIEVGLATAADDDDMRRLLRELPSNGALQIAFQREPSVWEAAKIEGDRHCTVVARAKDNDRLVGMVSRSVRQVWLNGRPARLGYVSQFRVELGYRLRVRKIAQGWRHLTESHRADELAYDLASMFADNAAARRFMAKGFQGFPNFEELESLTTLVLSTRQWRAPQPPAGVIVAPADESRLEEIVDCLNRNGRRYQFAPVWTAADLNDSQRCRGLRPGDFQVAISGGRVVGCLAIWDQRGFRQLVLNGYSRALALVRPLVNLAAPILGTLRLPRAGEAFKYAFLSHVAVDDDDPQMLAALVGAARATARRRGLEVLLLGLASRNPMLPYLRKTFRSRQITSVLYAARPPQQRRFDPVEKPDGRIPHVEIAVL
jgi:hypothetical protein